MQLLVADQVGSLNLQLAVLRNHLAHHTLNIMYTVLFYSAAVELVKVLTGGTHINIEYVNIGIGVLFAAQHCVLCGVHTADLGAVGLTLAVVATRADTLYEYDGVGMRSVGRTQQSTTGRTGSVHQTLELQRGDNVRALGVCKLVVIVQLDGVEAGSHDDCAVLFFDEGVGLLVVDSASGTNLGADTALAAL